MQATPSPQSPVILILLVLSILGAARDRAYKKGGGVRPDRYEKITLLVMIGVSILILAGIYLRSPGAAGTLTAVLTAAIFGFWELYRWQVRRRNPIGRIPRR
jgi:hypothetical protein